MTEEFAKYVIDGKAIIPEGVLQIENLAFSKCAVLTHVEIPSSVTKIGFAAFRDCTGLKSIIIPDTVIEIGAAAFWGCSELVSIQLSNSIREISHNLFTGCTKLVSILIPNSVVSIGIKAFSECQGLSKLVLPHSILHIEQCAFSYCTNLIYLQLPKSLNEIKSKTFCGCSKLESVIIPLSVTTIGNSAFKGCESLSYIQIPNTKTRIAKNAFGGCSALSRVDSPYLSLSDILDHDSFALQLKSSAVRYHDEFGMNISPICGVGSSFFEGEVVKPENKNQEVQFRLSFEQPEIDPYYSQNRHLLKKRQDDNLSTYDWQLASGVGVILGYNNYWALEFNQVSILGEKQNGNIKEFIRGVLKCLHLPEEYEWVISSDNDSCIQILFKSETIEDNDLINGSYIFINRKTNKDTDVSFNTVKLHIRNFMPLPPSLLYTGERRVFLFGTPKRSPRYISVDSIYSCLDVLFSITEQEKVCSNDFSTWGQLYYSSPFCGSRSFFFRFPDESHEDDTLKSDVALLQSCNNPKAYNDLGVLYARRAIYNSGIRDGNRDQAIQYSKIAIKFFERSLTDDAKNNLQTLEQLGFMPIP